MLCVFPHRGYRLSRTSLVNDTIVNKIQKQAQQNTRAEQDGHRPCFKPDFLMPSPNTVVPRNKVHYCPAPSSWEFIRVIRELQDTFRIWHGGRRRALPDE